MIWEITAYNGTSKTVIGAASLADAIDLFKKETWLNEMDIKSIVNLS